MATINISKQIGQNLVLQGSLETNECLFSETIRLMKSNLFELVIYEAATPDLYLKLLEDSTIQDNIIWTTQNANNEVMVYYIDDISITRDKIHFKGTEFWELVSKQNYIIWNNQLATNIDQFSTGNISGCFKDQGVYNPWCSGAGLVNNNLPGTIEFSESGYINKYDGKNVGYIKQNCACQPGQFKHLWMDQFNNLGRKDAAGNYMDLCNGAAHKPKPITILPSFTSSEIFNDCSTKSRYHQSVWLDSLIYNEVKPFTINWIKTNTILNLNELMDVCFNGFKNGESNTIYFIKYVYNASINNLETKINIELQYINNNQIKLTNTDYDDWTYTSDFSGVYDKVFPIPSDSSDVEQMKPLMFIWNCYRHEIEANKNLGSLEYKPIEPGEIILFAPKIEGNFSGGVWSIPEKADPEANLGYAHNLFNPNNEYKSGSGWYTVNNTAENCWINRNYSIHPNKQKPWTVGRGIKYSSSTSHKFGGEQKPLMYNQWYMREFTHYTAFCHHYIGRPLKNVEYQIGPTHDRNCSLYPWEEPFINSCELLTDDFKVELQFDNLINHEVLETGDSSKEWKAGSIMNVEELDIIGLKHETLYLTEFNVVHEQRDKTKYTIKNGIKEMKLLYKSD